MITFHTKLVVSKDNGGFVVEAPFVVSHPELPGHHFLTVPVGFSFDGNSVPRVTWWLSPPSDYLEAGCIHDYLYKNGAKMGVSRRTVDHIYREALDKQGLSGWRRWARWAGVRAFGWGPYKEVKDGPETKQG